MIDERVKALNAAQRDVVLRSVSNIVHQHTILGNTRSSTSAYYKALLNHLRDSRIVKSYEAESRTGGLIGRAISAIRVPKEQRRFMKHYRIHKSEMQSSKHAAFSSDVKDFIGNAYLKVKKAAYIDPQQPVIRVPKDADTIEFYQAALAMPFEEMRRARVVSVPRENF